MSTFNMWNVSCMLVFSVVCLSWVAPSHTLEIRQKLIQLQAEVAQIKEKLVSITDTLLVSIDDTLNEVAAVTTCPDNFTHFESSCYYFSEPLPRHGDDQSYARAQCEMKGSNLVSIETEPERDFIRNHTVSGLYWTSAHRHGAVWVWDATGYEITAGFELWSPGEPNQEDRYCAIVIASNGKLYDYLCTHSQDRYICETNFPACT